MDVKKLKQLIESKGEISFPLALKYEDNPFICDQYAAEICRNLGRKAFHIETLSEKASDSSIFDQEPDSIYVMKTEKFQGDLSSDDADLIVIAKEFPKNLSIDYVEIPKPVNWQIEDYVKSRVGGLTDQEIHWLCESAKYDVYRLANECNKFELFDPKAHEILFNDINSENGYSDLNSLTIFSLTNAILNNDIKTVESVLSDLSAIDIEGSGEMTLLCKSYRKLVDAVFSSGWTDKMTCSNKEFNFYKYKIGPLYSHDRIIKIYRFLTGLDMRLKSGELSFSSDTKENNRKFVEYISVSVLSLMRGGNTL